MVALACGRTREVLPASGSPAAAAAARSVLFVGLDGADWQFLEPLMASGRMPNLARLEREGSGGVLATEQPPLSPLLWTTMMTGRSPLEHRILDFVRFNPSTGRREPITNDERRVPAVWNIASEAAREVAIVGLWATFPADEAKGLLVSNVFLSAHGPVERALSPASATSWAEQVRRDATASVELAAMRRFLPDLSADELAAAGSSTNPFAGKVPGLRQVLVQTEIVRRLSVDWLTRHPTRLAAVYFEGTDTIGHLFAPFVAPPLAGVDPGDVARFADVPERYFELIDGVIGELATLAARSGAVLMIASDHGFEWGSGRPAGLSSVAEATAAKWHRDEGIYLLHGPGIPARPGHSGRGGVAQVASTLLTLVGLPSLPGMSPALGDAGPAPSQAFPPTPHPRAPEPPSTGVVDRTSQASDSRSRIESPATGEEEIRKLQALGYLGASGEGGAGPRPHGTRTAASFSNEAQILEQLGRTAEAMRCYEQALEQEPDDVAAKLNLSNLLFEGDRDAARSDRLLVEAYLGGLAEGAELVVARAAAWRERDRPDRARSLLDAAVAGAPANVPLRLFRGRHRVEQGDCQGAAADFAAAVQREERRAGSWAALATAQLCLGDRAAARRSFERAVALAPEREELRRALASLEDLDEPPPRR
ncbi:MAG: hypothetical protein QG573_2614 [Acidobacteriota bacterium]|nr:hypothetical protein [Acidobacteriota bacterium]